MAKKIDPVCGMSIEEEDAADVIEHQGEKYYFCSENCAEEFRANPEMYIEE